MTIEYRDKPNWGDIIPNSYVPKFKSIHKSEVKKLPRIGNPFNHQGDNPVIGDYDDWIAYCTNANNINCAKCILNTQCAGVRGKGIIVNFINGVSIPEDTVLDHLLKRRTPKAAGDIYTEMLRRASTLKFP